MSHLWPAQCRPVQAHEAIPLQGVGHYDDVVGVVTRQLVEPGRARAQALC